MSTASFQNTMRRRLEEAIVRRLVDELARYGYVPVAVHDGEDYHVAARDGSDTPVATIAWAEARSFRPVRALTTQQAWEAVNLVDEATIHFAPGGNLANWGAFGVFVVLGNGEDCIADYHARPDFSDCVDAILDDILEDPERVLDRMIASQVMAGAPA